MQVKARGNAHWTLFAPAVIVGIVYGAMWLILVLLGRGDGAVARIAMLLTAIGSPLLLVYGFLRYNSVWILVSDAEVWLARGWPRYWHNKIAYGDIDGVRPSQSFIGRAFKVGEVIVGLKDGTRLRVSDIEEPEIIAAAMEEELASYRASVKGQDMLDRA